MLKIEQIKLLESKVNKAIEIIAKLREENKTLKAGLTSAQKKIDELEDLVNSFKSEQDEIEQGIIRALKSLDKLEDEILDRTNVSDESNIANSEEPKFQSEVISQSEKKETIETDKINSNIPSGTIEEANNNSNIDTAKKDSQLDIF